MKKLIKIQREIKDQLKECTNFWLTNGIDKVSGGVYTCLDRTGKIYSTDKSVWMQGRCAWTFAYLCSLYGVDESWLKASESCLEFLEKYCINRENGRMYFTVTGDGKPTEPSTKGSTFKGPFHLPRMLATVDKIIDELI